MIVIRANELNIARTAHQVDVRKMFMTDDAAFIKILLAPGESLKKYISPVDAIFFGLSGKGMVEIGEETEEMEKNTLVFRPAKIAHRLFNPETNAESFEFLVVKKPTPPGKTILL